MRRYYLHTMHNGTFYAELVESETGTKLIARSTGTKNRDEALLIIAEWLKSGIPTGKVQDLAFTETAWEFGLRNLEIGLPQMRTLKFTTTEGIFTNLGLLLSDQSVHTVKLAVFEGLEKEIFKDRREFTDSLIKQLNDVYSFLDMYNHTHAEVKGLYRQDIRDYPEEALREALFNAVVHRDYAFSSSTLISIFDDRVEFVSIGGLSKGVSLDDILLGLSVPRNENLANVFYRLHLIEAYGIGIPKIIRSYDSCTRKPELKATGNAFKITLPNRNTNNHKAIVNRVSFTENEEKILALLNKQDEIVRKDLEAALNISQAMAVRLLRGLVDKGAIRAVGGGKKTRYVKAFFQMSGMQILRW